MRPDASGFVELIEFEVTRGASVQANQRETTLVSIRGRDASGDPMHVTVEFDDFEHIVDVVQGAWHIDREEASALVARLALQQMSDSAP